MAQISLILLDDVEKLGLAGDEVHVAPGYARNYLIPRGLAAKATPGLTTFDDKLGITANGM